jgi:Flp pilus assembly secretin CpaC
MLKRVVLIAIMIILAAGVDSLSRQASAQVIMLPTYRVFSIGTSVMVPDRGMAHLGGISTARESSVSRGVPGFGQLPMAGPLFANRAIGRELGHVGAHVTATIIDQRELDQQVLSAAARSRPGLSAQDAALARKAAFLNQHLARPSSSQPAPAARSLPAEHLSQIRQRQQQAGREQQLEGLELMIVAQQKELEGKLGVARIYYQQAARRLTGSRQQQVIKRLREIEVLRQAGSGR